MESSRFAHLALVLLLSLTLPLGGRAIPSTDLEPVNRQPEATRLRAHFDSVDAELRHRPPLQLTPAQRTARLTLIGWLREYRDAGRFPRNDRFPKQAMPFFRDSRGVLCAMAYLIDRSGRGDLVARVAATRNNAFIPELADDPELDAWLDRAGLSLAEAARIQPSYEPPPNVPEDQAVSADYALTSILVSGASLTTLGLNLVTPSRSSGWAGVVAGGVGMIAGAVNLDGTDATGQVAAANMIAGGVALAVGLHSLLSSRPGQTMGALSPQSSDGSTKGIAISPVVATSSGTPRLGLAMHTSF